MSTKLTNDQKAFIVEQLAAWEPPSSVVELVNQVFGLELTRQHVEKFDPTKQAGQNLSKRWREHFARAREAFKTNLDGIPAAHKAYRVRRLARMSDRAERVGNIPLAARLLEQIAKEVGEAFTNRREFTGKDGGPIATRDVSQMTDEQINAELARLLNGEGDQAGVA